MIAVLLGLLPGCSSAPKAQELELGQDAVVTIGTSPPLQRKKGDVVEIGSDGALVESPGYVSVLVLPGQRPGQRLKLTLRSLDNWTGEWINNRDNELSDDLLGSALGVQRLASQHRFDEATVRLESLMRKHPRLAALKFLEVGLLIYRGKLSEARELLTIALEEYPQSKGGQELYKMLYGRERSPAGASEKAPRQ